MEAENHKDSYNFQEGEIILIDKPYKWTSFDVVNKIRNLVCKDLGKRKIKVGHAGTLDPLATGLLIVCTGKFTKRINEFQDLDKEYTGTFYLGATSPSYDKETEIDKEFDISHINEKLMISTANNFIGEYDQIPPAFSAKKINGVRSYNLARKNKDVKLSSNRVSINEFEITKIALPEVHFRINCSKGTYIRSIARDFGEALDAGAYLTSLVRTKIGSFNFLNAFSIEKFENQLSNLKHG